MTVQAIVAGGLMGKTGVVWEPIFAEHVMGKFHPESPERIMRIKDVLDKTSVGKNAVRLRARPATKDEILLVHDREYIDTIEGTAGKTVMLDPNTTACPKTYEAALMAVGGVIVSTEAVLGGKVDNAYAFVRPPGHHAERNRAMGFCFFNNIAIAAECAIKKHNVKRIAIIDFDVHHGNGTQRHFYNRSDVFYISTHRWPFYPGTGSRMERGEGLGKGYTLNIPLTIGGDDEVKEIYGDVVVPIIREYRPELIFVSAGYDAHEKDPLAGFDITTGCYNWLMSEILSVAGECCGGKLVATLEGGYDVDALALCVEGALRVMEKA